MGNVCQVSLQCDALLLRCWDTVLGRKHYVSKLQDNLEAMDYSMRDLVALKNDLKRKVVVAEQQALMKGLHQVENWISRVEAVEAQVGELFNEAPQHCERLCCLGYCSKQYISSYKYGRRVARQLVEIYELKNTGVQIKDVAETVPADLVNEILVEPTVGMEAVIDEVWTNIENENVGVIGLFGMGGVGKTTLLTNIYNSSKHTLRPFDYVLWVTVSRDLKPENIQDTIGRGVGFICDEWKNQSQQEKARDIFNRLRNKRILLLLDDIWERIDLYKLGIPISGGSKLLFSTRSEDVCGRMAVQKKIKIQCLEWSKALNLFQQTVGNEVLAIHPEIPSLAETVAKECAGLPLALKTVGRAMASKKTPQEWNHAITVLKKVASEFPKMGEEVFPLLKYSYDSLPSDKIRACFLYCALFPEDYAIARDDLLDCWMCEGLLACPNVEEARNETYHIIGELLNACLLEEVEFGVKMHDVIRDMALWLTSDHPSQSFVVHTGAQFVEIPPNLGKWEKSRRVSFSANCLKELGDTPTCPNLLTLFLRGNELRCIDKEFFDFMPVLVVLDLSENISLERLPSGVSKLVALQLLNLSKTHLQELPDELKMLVKLLVLNLEDTRNLKSVPPSMMSSLLRLRVLRMARCASCETILFEGEEEVQGLKHFDELTLNITSFSLLKQLFSCDRLLRCITNLVLEVHGVKPEDVSFLEIWKYTGLQMLEVDREKAAQGPRDPMMTQPYCFRSLSSVTLMRCSNVKDLTWLVYAQNLQFLGVSSCNEMEIIVDGKKLIGMESQLAELKPFAKLAQLDMSCLPVLKSIFEIAINILNLKYVSVYKCPKLKKMPYNASCAQGCRNLQIRGEQEWWDGIEWEDQLAKKAFLPFFTPSEY